MKKHNFFFALVFLCFGLGISVKSNAQESYSTKGPKQEMTDLSKEKKVVDWEAEEDEHPYGGTFQLISSKELTSKELFTSDYLLPLVEKNRLENEEKIIQLSPNTKLRILSKKQIASADFKPFKKLYSFE